MSAIRRTAALAIAVAVLAGALGGGAVAIAKTSHAGWPKIDGRLIIHKHDESTPMIGTKRRHNELLGGHGDDTIVAGAIGDVLWGDYKPSGQPATQRDVIKGGAGKDFIYASHGFNTISSGGGADQIHAHFGRGTITCASPKPTIFLSHRSRKLYRLHGCPHISYQTVGH
jgi:hypothetical protein